MSELYTFIGQQLKQARMTRYPTRRVTLQELSKELNVTKLVEHVSVDWSSDVRLLTVKSLSLPEKSSPRALALVNGK